jgi:hypothetical protein
MTSIRFDRRLRRGINSNEAQRTGRSNGRTDKRAVNIDDVRPDHDGSLLQVMADALGRWRLPEAP